jgi:hypothetical protein
MAEQWIRWAIIGDCGLYVGQYLTREDAIADHVWSRDASLRKFAPLDDEQRAQWRKCKSQGDRAIKVLITPVGSVDKP